MRGKDKVALGGETRRLSLSQFSSLENGGGSRYGASNGDGCRLGLRRDWVFSSTRSGVSMSHLSHHLLELVPLTPDLENYFTGML